MRAFHIKICLGVLITFNAMVWHKLRESLKGNHIFPIRFDERITYENIDEIKMTQKMNRWKEKCAIMYQPCEISFSNENKSEIIIN